MIKRTFIPAVIIILAFAYLIFTPQEAPPRKEYLLNVKYGMGFEQTPRIHYFLSSIAGDQTVLNFVDENGILVKNLVLSQFGKRTEVAKVNFDGSIIVIFQDQKIVRLNKNGQKIWELNGGFHHDFFVDDHQIYALSRKVISTQDSPPRMAYKESISVIDFGRGFLKRTIEVNDITNQISTIDLEKSGQLLKNSQIIDPLHTNSISVIKCPLPKLCAKEKVLLLSFAHLDLVAITDLEVKNIFWSSQMAGIKLERQHQPVYLGNSKILIFDNGIRRKFSKIIEVDLTNNRITWEYSNPQHFFSEKVGGIEVLENENILVNSGMQGWIFEVTRDKDIIWEARSRKKVSKRNWSDGIIYRFSVDHSISHLTPDQSHPAPQ